jgi:hypothetical protein
MFHKPGDFSIFRTSPELIQATDCVGMGNQLWQRWLQAVSAAAGHPNRLICLSTAGTADEVAQHSLPA